MAHLKDGRQMAHSTTASCPQGRRNGNASKQVAREPWGEQRIKRIAWTGIVCPGLVAILLVWMNPLASHHDDDLMHFLIALWSWEDWRFLLDRWGRPGFTIPWAISAPLGWAGAKTFSVVVSIFTAWCVVSTARTWKLPASHWAGWLFWLQPLAFRLSQSTLTEVATAFYLALALLLHARGSLTAGAAVFSLTAITRHEMIAFLPLWSLALWRGSGWRQGLGWALRSAVLSWAFIAVNAAGYFAELRLPISLLGGVRDVTDYGAGTPLSFVAGLAVCSGPVIAALAAFGFAPLLKGEAGIARGNGGALCVVLLAAYFALQTILRTFGLFATGGYPRFLVAVAPAIALCACAAIPRSFAAPLQFLKFLGATAIILAAGFCVENIRGTMDLGTLHPGKFALISRTVSLSLLLAIWPMLLWFARRRWCDCRHVASVPALALFLPIVGQLWIVTEPPTLAAKDLSALLKQNGLLENRALTTDVWLGYLLGGRARDAEKLRLEAKDAPPGTVFVWDQQHGPGPTFRIRHQELIDLGFERLFTFGTSPIFNSPLYVVFRKSGSVKFSETSHWK